jgi:hypothetical protein
MPSPNTAPPVRAIDVAFGLAFVGGVAVFAWTIFRALLIGD